MIPLDTKPGTEVFTMDWSCVWHAPVVAIGKKHVCLAVDGDFQLVDLRKVWVCDRQAWLELAQEMQQEGMTSLRRSAEAFFKVGLGEPPKG